MKASLAIMVLAWALLVACTEDSPGGNDNNWFSVSIPQNVGRNLDLLFVVDNSSSMTDEFGFCVGVGLYDAFEGWPGELNLHVGVTSADLGAGPYTTIDSCEEVGGDRGILGMVGGFDQAELCIGPGQRYIVDVEPADCTIEKDENAGCISHSCDQTNCDAAARNNEVLTLAMDSDGCPRCRNYPGGSTLPETSQCLGSLGFPGCSFSQPLEAMYQALDDASQNTGFLREEAYLGIIFITDEDDCSVADPELFDPSQDSVDSRLGYFSAFRCFEFGVTCDINDRTYYGVRQSCRPRDDPGALLHAISRYVQFLGELKDPEMLIVAALAGPVEDWSVTVGPDDENRPEVQECCTGRAGYPGPRPGIRLKAFVEIFAEQDAMVWAYQSIRDFCQVTLPTITGRIQGYILRCVPGPLAGCADVGVEFGSPRAGQTCDINSRCLPTCLATDVFERGTANEQRLQVPHCLDVLPDGTVAPGNTDRSLAYAEGRPDDRDPNLPVSACWQIVFNENCPDSNYARLTISRQTDPPPRSFAEVTCRQIDQQEQNCDDGKDNDEDCRIDGEDPDCR